MALWHARTSFFFLLSSLDVFIKQHNEIVGRGNIQKMHFYYSYLKPCLFLFFYLHECIYSNNELVSTKAQRGHWIPWKKTEVVMNHYVHSGDGTWVLCKISKYFWLTASSPFYIHMSKAQSLNPIIISKIERCIHIVELMMKSSSTLLLLTAKHNFKKSNLTQKGMGLRITAKIIIS